jgi:hypothetical protein
MAKRLDQMCIESVVGFCAPRGWFHPDAGVILGRLLVPWWIICPCQLAVRRIESLRLVETVVFGRNVGGGVLVGHDGDALVGAWWTTVVLRSGWAVDEHQI